MKKILVLGTILTLMVAAASAQGPGDRIQRQRIERGFSTGQLTRPENFRLQKNQTRFNSQKRKAFRDGRLTPAEKRRLHNMKRHNRHETYRFKHNGRRRLM